MTTARHNPEVRSPEGTSPEGHSRKERNAAARNRKPENRKLDKEAILDSILEITAFYCPGGRKRAGRRVVFACGRCGKTKMEALPEKRLAGCFNASCDVPTTTDALGLVAFFENIDSRREFRAVLLRAHDILGLDPGLEPTLGSPMRAAAKPTATPPETRPKPDPTLVDSVYQAFMALCPATDEDYDRFWKGRGVSSDTVANGRFGSTNPRTTTKALDALLEVFGSAALLTVPGFFVNGRGRLSFTLTGEYALIPYHDRQGRMTNIEGRSMTPEQIARTSKYVSLRDSGSHLYVFPGYRADDARAFTEGAMGPILAAQNGIAVASIKGIRCYKGKHDGPLPEIMGAGFGGRKVPYIPDADDPPNPDVLKQAPLAARALVEPFGGVPALANLPTGMDLDDWLISLKTTVRIRAFNSLVAGARKL